MANFTLIIEIIGKASALILIICISLAIFFAPTVAPQNFTLPLQIAGIVTCFVRGAIVPRIWVSRLYLLIEFATAVISTGCLTIKYAGSKLPVLFIQACTNDSLVVPSDITSFSALSAIAALISFCVFEHLFFLAVKSSGRNLGFFGQFHAFLWTLLQSFGVALSWVIYGLANATAGLANATAACQMDQPLDEEERVGEPTDADPPISNPPIVNPPIVNPPVNPSVVNPPIENPPIEDHPVTNCPVGGFPLESSPPPPYVSALPSIMFTAHQDLIMQYMPQANDDMLRFKDSYELV